MSSPPSPRWRAWRASSRTRIWHWHWHWFMLYRMLGAHLWLELFENGRSVADLDAEACS